MKYQLKLLAAALAVVAAAPASAALIATGTSGNGNLVLSAWDDAAQTSYTLNLGITESAFTGTSNLTFAPDANMTTFLAAVTKPNVIWNVVAGDSVGTVASVGSLNYFATGASADPTVATGDGSQPKNQELLNSSAINTYFNSVNLLIPTSPGGNSLEHVSTGATDFAYANSGAFGAFNGGKYLAFDTSGILDQNLNIYKFSGGTGGNFGATTLTTYGTWNLASNGTLNYIAPSAVSAVPLPATAWLFGSGLVGLVGVSRRKNVKA